MSAKNGKTMKQTLPPTFRRSLIAALAIAPLCAFAADDCKNRGELDTNYCDEDNNLVAEAPKDDAPMGGMPPGMGGMGGMDGMM